MKKIKQCFLHIGVEKTGSTTIQSFCADNADKLKQQGILYPKILRGKRNNHFKMAVYAQDDDKTDDLRRGLGLLTPESVVAMRQRLKNKFYNEVNNAQVQTLLISNEHCHSRLVTVREVRRAYDLLAPLCQTIKVIVYLRPQHELAVSRYSTHIKFGGKPGKVFPAVGKDSMFYNYQRVLSIWSEVFGEDNIVPAVFNRKELVGGDVVTDFIDKVGIVKDGLQDVVAQNESLSMEALIFLGHLNAHLPPFVDGKPSGLRKHLVPFMEELFPGKSVLPARKKAECFYGLFADANQKVCERFFPEKNMLFDIDFSKFPEQEQYLELSKDQMYSMFAELWKKMLGQSKNC